MTHARQFRNLAGRKFMVGVGAQKAGTTWLFDYLGRHPDVAMSPIKELHYFDQIFRPELCGMWERDFNRQTSDHINLLAGGKTASISDLQYLIDRVRMNFDPSCYLEYFDRLATHGRPVVGEITPSYCLLPDQGFVEMRKSIERGGADPRIVFVMRDPVQRFWSQCRFSVGSGASQRSVDQAYEEALNDPNFVERTRYDWTIARILNAFSREEVLFLFYEDLFSRRSSERLCQFLQIKHVAPAAGRRLHVSVEATLNESRRRQLRAMFEPVYDFVGKQFSGSVPAQWQDAP